MSDLKFLVEALLSLKPNCQWTIQGEEVSGLTWLDENSEKPTDEELQTKIAELRVAQPLKELREERNRRIVQTDWRFRSDLSPSQEWKDYCVALRDLPANYSPTFDILTEDEYPLVKEDNTTPWPEEPTDG
tara:strand:+ start:604 stop:996 length:393 start_codon:yes stop_codon:yes gene_type:complete